MILLLVAASNYFGAVFSRLGSANADRRIAAAADVFADGHAAVDPGIIFVLGWPLEWVPIVLIVVPILLPLVQKLGINLIWFCTLVAVCLQTAWLSPPVALSAYFLKGVVPDWPLKDIYAGMMQFMVLQIVGPAARAVLPAARALAAGADAQLFTGPTRRTPWRHRIGGSASSASASVAGLRSGVRVRRLGGRRAVQPHARKGEKGRRRRRRRRRPHRPAGAHRARRHRCGRRSSRRPALTTTFRSPRCRPESTCCAKSRSRSMRRRRRQCATPPSGSGKTAMVGHEFRHTPQRRVHQGAARRRLHRPLPALHDRALPRPLRHARAAPADVDGVPGRKAAAFSARSARITSTGCATGSAKSPRSSGRLLALRPDRRRYRDQARRQGGNRRRVHVHARVRERRHRDDDRVVRRDARARREDRRHGRCAAR